MLAQQTDIRNNDNCTINDAIEVLFDKLNPAIDDLENGRVITEDELWNDLNSV